MDDEEANTRKGGKGKGKEKGRAGSSSAPDHQAVRADTHKYVEYANGEK